MNSVEAVSNSSCLVVGRSSPIKLYKRRWIILVLYILYAAINAFQWFEYAIIADVIVRFYSVSFVAVDVTSIIYMALYMPMVIPASFLMEKLNLRQIALIGVLGTAIGTILKIFSVSRNGIWVTYFCQTILSSMQVFILALPPRIAAVWFGSTEVSLACALGVFGTQLGQAIGLMVPPMVIKNHEQVEKIEREFGSLVYSMAIFTAVITVVILLSSPPTSPRETEHECEENFMKSLKKLLADRSFNFHAIAYGINIGVFVSISTLLNQFMSANFEESGEDAGRIGLIMIVLGMIGAIIFGYILDKTHAYKTVTFLLYFASFLSVVAFMYSLRFQSKVLVYLSGALVGLFINAYMPVGLEQAIELTYPEPESTSSGILISMTQTLGVVFTILLGWLLPRVGCFWALGSMAFFLFIGTVLTAMISSRTKRQNVLKRK